MVDPGDGGQLVRPGEEGLAVVRLGDEIDAEQQQELDQHAEDADPDAGVARHAAVLEGAYRFRCDGGEGVRIHRRQFRRPAGKSA